MTALLAIFGPDNEWADVFFFVAMLLLWFVGIVVLVTERRANWPHGVAWIALGFGMLAWLFITP